MGFDHGAKKKSNYTILIQSTPEFFSILLSGEGLKKEEMRQQWAEDVKLRKRRFIRFSKSTRQ